MGKDQDSKMSYQKDKETRDPQHQRGQPVEAPERVEQLPSPPTTPSGPRSRAPVDSVSSKLPRSPPPALSWAAQASPPPRPRPPNTQDSPPGARHQGGPGSPEQKLREVRVQPFPGHHIPEIITNVKESESTKQDIALPLPNQEHQSPHHLPPPWLPASTRSSSKH